MHVFSKFETCPREVLEEITLSLVHLSFLGPPAGILNLLPLSKCILKRLHPDRNPHLYARIFRLKFDNRVAVYRFGDLCDHATELTQELIRRCKCLQRLRENRYPRAIDTTLRADLWTTYLMFIESEEKNAKQLIEYTRVGKLVSEFIALDGRFHDGTDENGGWTVDSEINSLTAWLFWFTDKERVQSEGPIERQLVLQALAHLFVGSFKYPSTHGPITSFYIPPHQPPPPARALSLAASPVYQQCFVPDHFGSGIYLARPLLTPAVLLIYIARLEAGLAEKDVAPAPGTPFASAAASAVVTASQQGVNERQVAARTVDWGYDGVNGVGRYEHDWLRLVTCHSPWCYPPIRNRLYTPGMLTGVWVGRLLAIPMVEFFSFLAPEQSAHVQQPSISHTPIQFRLREHHQHVERHTVDFDDLSRDNTGSGVLNAWFHEDIEMVESNNELLVYAPDENEPCSYRTYDPSAAAQATLDEELEDSSQEDGLYGEGVWDIILTAETDEEFGRVWGQKRYYGRVRDWDGLIMLVEEVVEGSPEKRIFYGYVHGEQNLVGRWRETETSVDQPGWEGAWSMTKVE